MHIRNFSWLLSVMICFSKYKVWIDKLTLRISQSVGGPGCQEAPDHHRQKMPSHLHTAKRQLLSQFWHSRRRTSQERGEKEEGQSQATHLPLPAQLSSHLALMTAVCQRYSHWPRIIISSRRHINSPQVVLKSPNWSFNLYTVSSVHFIAAISVPLTYQSLTCALLGSSSDVKVTFLHLQKKQLKFISHRLVGPIRKEDAVKQASDNFQMSTAVSGKRLLWQLVGQTSHRGPGPVSQGALFHCTGSLTALWHHQVMISVWSSLSFFHFSYFSSYFLHSPIVAAVASERDCWQPSNSLHRSFQKSGWAASVLAYAKGIFDLFWDELQERRWAGWMWQLCFSGLCFVFTSDHGTFCCVHSSLPLDIPIGHCFLIPHPLFSASSLLIDGPNCSVWIKFICGKFLLGNLKDVYSGQGHKFSFKTIYTILLKYYDQYFQKFLFPNCRSFWGSHFA